MADLQTYFPIATQTLGSSAASVTFTGISQAYTDLIIQMVHKAGTGSNNDIHMTVGNGTLDTANNYSNTTLDGNGSSASSFRETSIAYCRPAFQPGSAQNFATTSIHFINYSNTTTYKTFLSRYSSAENEVFAGVQLWRNTNAINTISLLCSSGLFAANSTFTLYGIKAA